MEWERGELKLTRSEYRGKSVRGVGDQCVATGFGWLTDLSGSDVEGL
jgi:hypothetical protein